MNWQEFLLVPCPQQLDSKYSQEDFEDHIYQLVECQERLSHLLNKQSTGNPALYPSSQLAAKLLSSFFYETVDIVQLITKSNSTSHYSANMRTVMPIVDRIHFYSQSWLLNAVSDAYLSKSIPDPPYFNRIVLHNPTTDITYHTAPIFGWIKHVISYDWDVEPYLENLLSDGARYLLGVPEEELSAKVLVHRNPPTVPQYLANGKTIEIVNL